MIKVINVINTKEMKKEEVDALIKFYNNYDNQKFELVIIIPTKEKIKSNLKKTKIKVIEVDGLEKSTFNFNVLRNLIKIFKEEKPDIVHSFDNTLVGIASKFLKECKFVFTGECERKKNNKIKDKIWNELVLDKMINFNDLFNIREKNKDAKDKNKDESQMLEDVSKENIQNMYEILEREPKMKKVNLLDIFIILIVFVACIIGYKFIKTTDNNVVTSEANKVVYQVRTSETFDEVYDMIEIGTPVYESRKNYLIGTIIDKQVEKSIRYGSNIETGEYVATEIDGRSDIILTIEALADIGTQNIMIQDFELKVGSEAYIKGKGYAALGYVVEIER